MTKTRKTAPAPGPRSKFTRTEEAILRVLKEKPGITLNREAIAAAVWPDYYLDINISNLDKHICNIRPKLPGDLQIRSAYGTGYGLFKK